MTPETGRRAGSPRHHPFTGLEVLEGRGGGANRALYLVRDYQADNVSEKALRIALSYTDFVNQRVSPPLGPDGAAVA